MLKNIKYVGLIRNTLPTPKNMKFRKRIIGYAPFCYERQIGIVLFRKIVIRAICPKIFCSLLGVP